MATTSHTTVSLHIRILTVILSTLVLAFPTSTIAQPCSCPFQGDADGSGTLTIVDVNQALNVVFFNAPIVTDPDCPRARIDYNCDDIINIVDVQLMIAHQFFFGAGPCDPCVCLTNPPACDPNIQALGSVVVESKTVLPGELGVQVGVYVSNPVDLATVVIPLEIREVTPGAFPTGLIDLQSSGRFIGASNAELVYFQDSDPGAACSGPTSSGYLTSSGVPVVATAPTNGLRIAMYRGFVDCFSAGTDGAPGVGVPSAIISFDAGLTPGIFEIDTCCNTPGHHLLFSDCSNYAQYLPSFTKGVITIEGDVPMCLNSVTDDYLLTCPRGDIAFTIQLRDEDATPMSDVSGVTLDFSNCSPAELIPLPGAYPNWPIVDAPAPSDANGIITFSIAAGGDCPDCSVMVSTPCGFSRTVPVRSTDIDGDAWVLPTDFDDSFGLCRDLNADGEVDDMDYQRHLAHCCDHRFPGDPCDWLSQNLTLDPDGGFEPTDTIDLFWSLVNNEQGSTCSIDSVVIEQSEWTPVPIWEYVTTIARGVSVNPGEMDRDSIQFEIPNYGQMCIRAQLYSNCCTTPQKEVVCVDVNRQCPPDAVCFQYHTLHLADADTAYVRHNLPLGLGWSYVIVQDADTTITTICTSDITSAGTEGTLTHWYKVGTTWNHFDYRVVQELFKGDMSGSNGAGLPDCVVDAVDLNFLIDYLFFGGPPSFPDDATDLNCDGAADAVDLNRHIDILFFGAPPPPLCGDGPGT